VRQKLLAAQLAFAVSQAPEELPLDGLGDDDDGDENEEGEEQDAQEDGSSMHQNGAALHLRGHALEDLNSAQQQSDEAAAAAAASSDPLDSMFARPWSAHARSVAAQHSARAPRPQSAARGRLIDAVLDDAEEPKYASFALPLRSALSVSNLHAHQMQQQPTAASAALQQRLQGNINVSAAYSHAFAQSAAARSAAAARPGSGLHGGQTPRGSLPVSQNPFLLKGALLSAQR